MEKGSWFFVAVMGGQGYRDQVVMIVVLVAIIISVLVVVAVYGSRH